MPALLIPYTGRLTGALDGFERASTAANTILSSSTATPLVISIARFGLGLIAILHGDVEDAREQYQVIKQWRGTYPNTTVVTDRLLGLLAQTMGNLAQAAEHGSNSVGV